VSRELKDLTDVDRLIHEPARLTIVAILSVAERADFLFLLHETGLTKGNLSAHLVRLEQAGYVEIEKTYRGKVPYTCRLAPGQAFPGLRERMRLVVSNGLGRPVGERGRLRRAAQPAEPGPSFPNEAAARQAGQRLRR
jgi:DNA-binding transcriptional ArsR family regulator